MTFDPTTKKAALFSGLLHLFALLFLVLGVIFASLFARDEEPFILEMVALPESMEIVEAVTVEPIEELTLDIPEFEPVEIQQPEPVVETPPPPKLVEQKPPPVPVEKPKPEPKIITFDEFVEDHGKPKPRPIPDKPKPRVVKPRKIDTSKIEKNLQQLSVTELSITTTTTTVDNDAMKNWRSLLAARLDALWKQIDAKGAAGNNVRISFYISSGGSISSVQIVRSSGISELDNSGKTTVFNLGSFQPPPSGKGETITVLFKVE